MNQDNGEPVWPSDATVELQNDGSAPAGHASMRIVREADQSLLQKCFGRHAAVHKGHTSGRGSTVKSPVEALLEIVQGNYEANTATNFETE